MNRISPDGALDAVRRAGSEPGVDLAARFEREYAPANSGAEIAFLDPRVKVWIFTFG
jgi:hypothetical protein